MLRSTQKQRVRRDARIVEKWVANDAIPVDKSSVGVGVGRLRAGGRLSRHVGFGGLDAHGVVGVAQEHVREARLEEVHGEDRRVLDYFLQQQVDGVSVSGAGPVCFESELQQAGGGQLQEIDRQHFQ